MMSARRCLILLGCGLALAASAGAAAAACPPRLGVAYGDTLTSIARACGISVEALRDRNPGLSADTLRAGTFLTIPAPALPTRQLPIGGGNVVVMPPLVTAPVSGGSSTVILPPQPPPIPRQHILPGFGNKPGQLPLPPGHSPGDPLIIR